MKMPSSPASSFCYLGPRGLRPFCAGMAWMALSLTTSAAQPVNDNFAQATVITGAAGVVSGGNAAATMEEGEEFHFEEPGGASVWWRWTAPENGLVTFHTFGSDFDTLLAVYTGDLVNGLEIVAADDESGPGGESIVTIEAVAGTTYQIAVDGYDTWNGLGPATGAIALHWAPQLTNDDFLAAATITGASGITAARNEGAAKEPDEPDHADNAGGASLWWNWTAPENAAISFNTFGSDFDTLLAVYTGGDPGNLTQIAASDDVSDSQSMVNFVAVAGTTYRIAVDGFAVVEGLEPELGTIVLQWGAPLANDDFASTASLTGASGSITTTNGGATSEDGEPEHADGIGGSSLWWQWTAPASGVVTFDTFGSSADTLLAVYSGDSIESLTLVADNDDFLDFAASRLRFTAVAGTVYRIAVDSWDGEAGTLVLNWGPPPANDDFGKATALVGMSGSTIARNVGAGSQSGEPDHADETGGSSVWWKWTAPAGGPVSFDTFGSDFDTLLAVYTGNTLSGLTLISSNDEYGDFFVSRVSFAAIAGATYYLAVDGYDGEIGNIRLNWGAPLSSVLTWVAGFGISGSNAALDSDPDGDLLPNAVEYILGSNPAVHSAAAAPVAAFIGNNLVFTFNRVDASETPDVVLTVESSPDSDSWPVSVIVGRDTASSGAGVSVAENGTEPDTIAVTIPRSGNAGFARLKAVILP